MHRLINVSANSLICPCEHNLKLFIVQEETDNMLHAYLDLENYAMRMKASKLSAWVQSEEKHSGESVFPSASSCFPVSKTFTTLIWLHHIRSEKSMKSSPLGNVSLCRG